MAVCRCQLEIAHFAGVNGKIYVLGSHRENREFSLDVEVFDTGFRGHSNRQTSTRWGELKAEQQR